MLIINQQNDKDPKRTLILAGGGMRVAYQAGVMKALEEEKLVFSHADGASGGIFNAAMLATGHSVNKIINKWKSLNFNHFTSLISLKEYFTPWKLRALGDADGIRDKILPHFEVSASKIKELNLPVTFSVCNFTKKTVDTISTDQLEENHLLAGVSLPILMPALKIKNDWFIDAVWIKDANLMEAVKRGAEDIWLIWGIGNYPAYLPGSLNQYVHSIEMSANGALFEEFEQIKWINKLIELGNSPFGQTRPIQVFIVKPKLPLPLDPELFLKKITARSLINMGYQDTKNYLREKPEYGDSLDFRATQTKNSGDYLCLPMKFSGKLEIKDKKHQVDLYIFLRKTIVNEVESIEAFSSIYIKAIDQEIIGGLTKVTVYGKGSSETLIEIETNVNYEEKAHLLKAELRCSSPWNWLMGLAFKSVDVKIYSSHVAPDSIFMEGKLYQSFITRIKAVGLSLAKKKNGSNGGIGFKFGMIKNILQNEV
ncbi:patatin-like phospholipase family protein [uncultured Cyclobacterium sp.]|mgnify:CR=1 FL=1|uniref:patatin-like phospholipase family protein n=1 Tax=uncultured Cyclobacterium sp. TaxID=453820 RepID=UPI0030EB75E6|tara:strand:- start:49753 stop:51198 length:1446 start_codon:yes stop_codon:yes gene_type:complete